MQYQPRIRIKTVMSTGMFSMHENTEPETARLEELGEGIS